MSPAWRSGRRTDRADGLDVVRLAAGGHAETQIVLAAPSRARVAGAAVASASAVPRGAVPVIALWQDPSAERAVTVGNDADRVATDPTVVDGADVDGTTVRRADADGTNAESAGDDRSDSSPTPWATPRARRAAATAQRVGVDAVATGNTVRVALPADEAQAVAAFERLAELPGRGPLTCVVARRWGSAWLRVIEDAGAVRAAGPAVAVAASRATLRRHGVDVAAVPRPTGAVAAALLHAGWTARGLVRSADGGRGEHGAAGTRPGERRGVAGDGGQALLLVLLGLTLAITLVGVLGAVAMAMSGREDRQRAVDVAALAAAAQLRAGATHSSGGPSQRDTDVRTRAATAARTTARENGVATVEVDFPDGDTDRAAAGAGRGTARIIGGVANAASGAVPTTVRVRTVHRPTVAGVVLAGTVTATAEVATPGYAEAVTTGDEYAGPLAIRQGKPMRPDVALAFDRMNAAATAAGHPLSVVSGYRSNAEQARLFAAHPDPKWVARPGTSLHRLGTELDLGPASAYGWLAANGERFGFRKRYSWEPWHFGYVRETASAHVAEQGRNPAAPPLTHGTIPPWVPAPYREPIRAASIRFKVSAALLSAQLKAESDFDPRTVSSAGARGIAQFMPGTAAAVGLRDPFDPAQAIPAQARLMAGLLRRFGSVPLALAAYNAGEGRVGACHCVPPYPETQRYVARIIALMRGYDDASDIGLTIRLVA